MRRATVLYAAWLLGCGDDVAADDGALYGSSGAVDGTDASGAATTASADESSGAATTTTTTAGSSSGDDASSGDGGPMLDVGNDDPPPGCVGTAEDFMFLIDIDGGLHRYDPDANVIAALGTPQCQDGDHPMALTIDRGGTLWALASDEDGYRGIFTIDPDTLACDQTAFVDPFDRGYTVTGGLAFVADSPGSVDESLYLGLLMGGLDPTLPMTLAKVDTTTMEVSTMDELPIVGNDYFQIADLVGTGDSRLFGFFTGEAALVAEIDETAHTIVVEQPLGFGVGSPWAFAQWSGRLWLFSPGDGVGSQVRAFDLVTQDVEVIEPDLGASVVGAAVSTCAPYEPEG